MSKEYKLFKDKAFYASAAIILIVTLGFTFYYSPWSLLAILAYAAIFWAFRKTN